MSARRKRGPDIVDVLATYSQSPFGKWKAEVTALGVNPFTTALGTLDTIFPEVMGRVGQIADQVDAPAATAHTLSPGSDEHVFGAWIASIQR
jgi:hypothetical protein